MQTFTLPVGDATVFYPESTPQRVRAALLLEVDRSGMVKRRLKSRDGLAPGDYVTDRPYAASSMLAVALGRVFNTALNGRSDSYPELAAAALRWRSGCPRCRPGGGVRCAVGAGAGAACSSRSAGRWTQSPTISARTASGDRRPMST
ncbi:MAG: hypothetical protein R2719_05375 [Micropruina sp.]